MIELGLIKPASKVTPGTKVRMAHNESHKFESAYLGVNIEDSPSVMLSSLAGTKTGIWVAHGEGRFHLPFPPEATRSHSATAIQHIPATPTEVVARWQVYARPMDVILL